MQRRLHDGLNYASYYHYYHHLHAKVCSGTSITTSHRQHCLRQCTSGPKPQKQKRIQKPSVRDFGRCSPYAEARASDTCAFEHGEFQEKVRVSLTILTRVLWYLLQRPPKVNSMQICKKMEGQINMKNEPRGKPNDIVQLY